MEKIYIIKERYQDSEGYDHYRLFNTSFFESESDAMKVVEEEKRKALDEDWEYLDIYVDELTKAMEE